MINISGVVDAVGKASQCATILGSDYRVELSDAEYIMNELRVIFDLRKQEIDHVERLNALINSMW